MKIFRSPIFVILFGFFAGAGLGLAYAWLISPVTYVDANPAILRADFKDQYRIVISAAYAATHDLPRARARLELLGDANPTGELSALAQRILAKGEPKDNAEPLAQLAADLQQGFASAPVTQPPVTREAFASTPFAAIINTLGGEAPTAEEIGISETSEAPAVSTLPFEQTPLAPQLLSTATPRPTFTPTKGVDTPFTLVDQEIVCDPNLPPGLLQFNLMDARRDPVAGIQIVVTWDEGEDSFFTGFKPEVSEGYADFTMETDIVYSIRVVDGGSFVPNISAPACDGASYLGGLLLTFQQP